MNNQLKSYLIRKNLKFEITFPRVIYYSTTSNNCSSVHLVLLLHRDTPAVVQDEEQPYIAQFPSRTIN